MRDLFRTPTADEAGGGPLHPDDAKAKGQTLRLTGQILALTGDLLPILTAHSTDTVVDENADVFGRFRPAVDRWESVVGRPAPDPVEPLGRNGKNKLSPRFAEWMMGLPDGWVTDIPGIKYRNQMRILGNGVVPQQGAKAISDLLGDFMDEEKEA